MTVPTLTNPPKPLTAEDEELRLIVFGEPGVGKTTLAMSAPRPLVLDFDRGLIAVALDGVEALTIEPTSMRDIDAIYWWCKENAGDFDSIVIDSLDEMIRLVTDQIVDEGKGKKENSTVTDLVPEQAEYLANQRYVHRTLSDLRKLRKHMLVTSGVRDRNGKSCPNVSPGLLPILNHFASVQAELVVLTIGEQEAPAVGVEPGPHRVLVTAPSATRAAKTRFRVLEPYVVEPTFPKVWDLIQSQRADRPAA